MNNLFGFYREIKKHFKAFGINGVRFYLSNAFGKKDLITIHPKGFEHPITMRRNSSDITTFYDIFFKSEYKINYRETPAVIIDAGANIGLACVYFKKKFPNARIIAIEPESKNFDLLKMNTDAYKDITCVKAGIWNRTTNLEVLDIGLGNWGFITKEFDVENEHTIKAISISEIMSSNGIKKIDLLKIDIEGSEKELFEKNYEPWLSNTGTLLIELHDRMKPGCAKSFFKAVVNYDFDLEHKGENVVCHFIKEPQKQ